MSVDQPKRRLGGIDVGAARDVLLEDVVLDGPAAAARRATPCSSPTTTYIASRIAAVALMVIEVETRSSGMPRKRSCRSSTVSMATPTRPTSPSAIGWSES